MFYNVHIKYELKRKMFTLFLYNHVLKNINSTFNSFSFLFLENSHLHSKLYSSLYFALVFMFHQIASLV